MSTDPKAIVEEFLRIVMIPDPQGARAFVAPDVQIRFTGARVMQDIAECSAFNAGRYRWVKKRFERTDVVQGADDNAHRWCHRALSLTPANRAPQWEHHV